MILKLDGSGRDMFIDEHMKPPARLLKESKLFDMLDMDELDGVSTNTSTHLIVCLFIHALLCIVKLSIHSTQMKCVTFNIAEHFLAILQQQHPVHCGLF
jgi:hypothetical protein